MSEPIKIQYFDKVKTAAVDRAKRDIDVVSMRRGDGWYWGLERRKEEQFEAVGIAKNKRRARTLLTQFHTLYKAKLLEAYANGADKLIPAFASADIEVYPYQVASAIRGRLSPLLCVQISIAA
jgi:hypothetical protein